MTDQPRKPFDKIAAGLTDALAYTNGDRSKGRAHFVIPNGQLDAAAREAFRGYVAYIGGCHEVARRHKVDARTVERMFAGERDVPPGLAREIAKSELATADAASARANVMLAWANSREQADG